MSAAGLCFKCGTFKSEENARQLAAREGPYYEHFIRRRFLKALRAAEDLHARSPQFEKAS